MDLLTVLRLQARANRLANHRLHGAMAALSHDEVHAPRSSFFPSLMATLNHILAVDQYYVGALLGQTDRRELREHWARFVPDDALDALAARQAASDERLIGLCDALDAARCDAIVELPRRDHVQRERAGFVLQHLAMHQTHHRGQVHTMLSGSAVAPPQLDEFLLPSEAALRRADMAALGWDEAAVYGG